jgi:peptide/nickel transport system substrate-binding protein
MTACAAPARGPADTESSSGSARPAGPKRVVAATIGDPFTVYQKLNIGNSVRGINEIERMVHAGLTITDNTGTLRPQLAEAVPSVENGNWRVFPDGTMETSWKIRDGAAWHDGTPLTADDLAFTFRVVSDRDLPTFRNRAYPLIERVEAVDAQTVVARWRRPFIEADTLFSETMGMPLPKHILESLYTDDKANFTNHAWFISMQFVGLGPFKLKEWVRASHMVVQANERYVLGRPKLDEIEIRTIPDSNAIVANVLAGAIDIVIHRSLSLDQSLQLREHWREGKVDMPISSLMMLYPQLLNPTPAIVTDLQFRRAVLHAIDRQTLADGINYGLTSPAFGFLEPDRAEYKETESAIVRYEYDANRAAQMFAGLGLTKAADGFYRDRDAPGQRLHLELRATSGDINTKTMFSVADMLQRVGVYAESVIIPQQRVDDQEYRTNFPSFTVNGQPIDLRMFERFHSNQARLPENNYVGENRPRYMNPELDGLIDRYVVTIARAERMELARGITRHVTENLPLLPLFYDSWPTASATRLVNVGPAAAGGDAAWNSHLWDIR